MTKTLRKSLVAILIVLLSVFIGLAAVTSLGAAHAEETQPTQPTQQTAAQRFDGYVANFATWAKEKAKGESTEEPTEAEWRAVLTEENLLATGMETLWNDYNLAKGLYIQVLKAEEKANIADPTTWGAIDTIFSRAYGYVAQAHASMNDVSVSKTYADHDKIVALEEEIGVLENYGADELHTLNTTAANVQLSEGELRYLAWATTVDGKAYAYFARAKRNMDAIKANIDAAIEGIKAISYYDEATKEMVVSEYTAAEAQKIVLDSETSIEAAKTLVEKVLEADRAVYITNYAAYNTALEALATEKGRVETLVTEIARLYELVVEGEVYYTYKEEITTANTNYSALATEYCAKNAADDVNFNDLQAYMDEAYSDIFDLLPTKQEHISAKDALDAMVAYIEGCDTKIAEVVTLIDQIPAKGTPEYDYTPEFETALKAAEEAFNALDKDIIAHDEKEYTDHADNVAEGAYWVNGYDKMADARKDYNEWDKVVQMLLGWVDELIALDALTEGQEGFETKGTDLINKYNDIMEYYQNENVLPAEGARLTQNQSNKFKTTEKAFRGVELVPVHEILGQIFADITRNTAKTGTLDTDINNLYAETVLAEKCVFAKRAKLEELMDTYNNLESDEVRSYVSNYAMLQTMWEEYQAELALVEAWDTAMEAVVIPVTVANWDKVDAAEEAFKALVHGEEVLGEELGLLQTAVSTDTEYAATYTTYAQAIEERETLKAAILDAVQKMIQVDTTEQAPEAIEAWKLAFDNIKLAVDALDTHEGAMDYIKNNREIEFPYGEAQTGTYGEAYDKYQQGLALYQAYTIVVAINNIYTGPAEDAATKVTLAMKDAITEARGMYDTYVGTGEAYDEAKAALIYNYDKLQAAEAALNAITVELRAWMITVIKIFNPTFEAAEDITINDIETELAKAAEFCGYPVNIGTTDDESENGLKALATFRTEYEALVGADVDKANYVAAAYELIKENGTLEQRSQLAIDTINTDIAAIQAIVTDRELTAEELTKVEDIIKRYEAFHASQQALVENYEALKNAFDQLTATQAFRTMLEELYTETVVNKNVTSFCPYYLAALKAIHNQFPDSVKATFMDYDQKVAEIEAAIAEAEAAGELPALTVVDARVKEIEAFLGTLEGLEGGLTDLINKEIEDAKAELVAELANLFATSMVTYSVTEGETPAEGEQTPIQAAMEQFKAGIEATIDQKVGVLREEIMGLLGNLQFAEGEDLAKLLTAIQERITTLEAFQKTINETTIPAFNKAIEDINTALTEAVGNLETKLQAEIDTINTLLGKIELGENADLAALLKSIQDRIATLETFKTSTETSLASINESITGINTAIDQINTDLGTLETKLTKYVDDQINATKEALEAEIKDINDLLGKVELGKYKDLATLIEALQTEVANLNAFQADAEGKIADLTGRLEAVEELLNGVEENVQTAIETAVQGLSDKIDSLLGELELGEHENLSELLVEIQDRIKTLENFKTSANSRLNNIEAILTGIDETVVKAIDAVKSALEAKDKELENKDKELENKDKQLEEKDKELEDRIAALESKTSTLVVFTVIIGILTLVAVACIVVLFLKRKSK